MPEPLKLSSSEQQLIGDFCVLAERLSSNGVWMGQVRSATLSLPITIVVGIGEQAGALHSTIMGAVLPGSAGLIEHVGDNHKGF